MKEARFIYQRSALHTLKHAKLKKITDSNTETSGTDQSVSNRYV